MTTPRPCPSCRSAMHLQPFKNHTGKTITLPLCFSCQGLWINRQENVLLWPAAVADLFKLLLGQRDTGDQPLATVLNCPDCAEVLSQGFDVVPSGRYITYRCSLGHGRFSTFSSFMIEKGFVRQLTGFEIADITKITKIITCGSCGSPVDLRKDPVCPNCRSAFSLLDPQAADSALRGYTHAAGLKEPPQTLSVNRALELADALMEIERQWKRAT